jgi:tRNA dimethylallyltransferase
MGNNFGPTTVPMPGKTCFVIVGPTAVGKTALAISLAKKLGSEIISADSRQCFRELNIGVARPSEEELQSVKHHFIASHSILDEVNAAVFELYALDAIKGIFDEHDFAVMVGGTGLYIKAFCEGIDLLPAIPPELRSSIISGYEANGLEWLQDQVHLYDPVYYGNGEIHNPRRLMRALEVIQHTGRSIRSFQSGMKVTRPFEIVKIGLDLPRIELYKRVNSRVDQMMEAGLLAEVIRLADTFKVPTRINALNTVGYSELFDYLDGKLSLEAAIEQIKINTRHYAKRQMTWFRKDPDIKWFTPDNKSEIIHRILRDSRQ